MKKSTKTVKKSTKAKTTKKAKNAVVEEPKEAPYAIHYTVCITALGVMSLEGKVIMVDYNETEAIDHFKRIMHIGNARWDTLSTGISIDKVEKINIK